MNLNKEIQIQAEQFVAYFYKLKNKRLNDAFRFWAESKDFDKKRERAIRYAVYGLIRHKNTKLKPVLKQKGF